MAGPAVRGRVVLGTATSIQLDNPLKLMDPNGPETLGKVRMFQAHAMTVPGIRQPRRPFVFQPIPRFYCGIETGTLLQANSG